MTLLPDLMQHGLRPRVICAEVEGRYAPQLRRQGISVVAAEMTGPLDLRHGSHALALALGVPADVVLTFGTLPQCIGRVAARLRGVPHFVNDHRGVGLELPKRERRAQRLLAPGAAGVIAVTEDQVDDLVSRGYRPERIHVIPNAVDDRRVTPRRPRDAVRSELGLDGDTTAVLCASNLRREKRVDLFCRAVAHARGCGADVVGLVAGDGPEREAVAAVADPQAVRLLGQREDIGDLLGAADVACSSSAVEAQSLFLLEALTAGLPLVATAVGGSPEIALHGEAGLLVPADDVEALGLALAAIAGEPALRRRMANAAREASDRNPDRVEMSRAYAAVLLDGRCDSRPRTGGGTR